MSVTAKQMNEDRPTSVIEVAGRQIQVNQDGYLINFEDWSEDVAMTMAEIDRLELTDCHWAAINFLRDYFNEYEVPPSPRVVIKQVGNKIDAWGCTNKTLEQAFPQGGCKHACRLAGLPSYYCHAC